MTNSETAALAVVLYLFVKNKRDKKIEEVKNTLLNLNPFKDTDG